MATKNLPLTIKPVGDFSAEAITFTAVSSANDYFRIPRRYPFVDIANLTHLRNIGFFRHKVAGSYNDNVSTEYGSNTTNTEGKLGYQLPQTEKLVLLVKSAVKGASASDNGEPFDALTIEGSTEYGIPDLTIQLPYADYTTPVEATYVLDTYDFGLYIKGVDGEDGMMIKVLNTGVKVALVVRAY